MSEDREQEARNEKPEGTSRPVTAAARRERRASARPAGRRDRATRVTDSGSGTGRSQVANTKAAEAKKGRPTPSRDRKEGKGSPVKRLTRFLREVVAELRKVIWPSQKQLLTYTFVVLIFVSVMIALVFGLDAGFGKGVFWLFG